MAKKRKSRGSGNEGDKGPDLNVGESRKRIRDFEDVADSDDEFHINGDKVLLGEEPEAKRRRKWAEQEEFLEPSDEEVLDYSGGESDEDEESGFGNEPSTLTLDDELGSDFGEQDDEANEENEYRWGTSKDDLYGADDIETEEQAHEEEAEARRLQKKQLESMTAADYGFDETDWQDVGAGESDSEEDNENVVTEALPRQTVTDDMTDAEKLKFLNAQYPEFEPLNKELFYVKEFLPKPGETFKSSSGDTSLARSKFLAALAYQSAITMYFAFHSSMCTTRAAFGVVCGPAAMNAIQLHNHPVMQRLVECRELWLRVKDLEPNPDLEKDALETEEESSGVEVALVNPSSRLNMGGKQPQKSRAQRHAEAVQAAAATRKAERMQRTEADLANLDALIASSDAKRPAKQKRNTIGNDKDSDLGDEVALTSREVAEKAKRKKSLRFYTSQIAQKASKRGAAGRNAGGDDDIPYRERLKDRQARLNSEAEKRGKRNGDAEDELGGESDDEDHRQAEQIRAGDDADYYDLIASRTSKKKADKAAFAEAQRQAALQGGQVVPEETVGADGKRKITYAIEKNKGLTPHRKKAVRNPRVKKRKKFDEKKKKLGSIKPVYKGGEGRGGYGGEMTGIKTGLVKSVKL